MKKVSSAGQETYTPEEGLADTPKQKKEATLVDEVVAEAQKLIAAGKNARFTCDGVSEYDLACQVINEAKKIVAMGYNAVIECSDEEPDKTEREKRKAFNKWKRMNR